MEYNFAAIYSAVICVIIASTETDSQIQFLTQNLNQSIHAKGESNVAGLMLVILVGEMRTFWKT